MSSRASLLSFIFLSTILGLGRTAFGDVALVATTNKGALDYNRGDQIVFNIQALDEGKVAGPQKLKWVRTGDDGKTESGEGVASEGNPLKISTSLAVPGFVRLDVTAVDENDKPVLNTRYSQPVKFSGGAGVAVNEIKGAPEPSDFDAFWTAQKARLSQVPVKATLTQIPSTNPDFFVYDVRVDCPGGKPVSGYLTKPKNTVPKSLKAFLGFRGYGVSSADLIYMGDKICFSINAHGIENGREQDYYRKLAEGELRDYGFNKEENAKPETTYFNGMTLRVLRALEFLKTIPEWNGKDLIVNGGSQGGLQALMGASLDKSVTACDVSIPWFCDLSGAALGRLKATWRPEIAPGLAYYDGANFAKRITCPVTIVAGLGDSLSPPSSIMVLYNNLSSRKSLEMFQGMIHQPFPPAGAQSFVLQAN